MLKQAAAKLLYKVRVRTAIFRLSMIGFATPALHDDVSHRRRLRREGDDDQRDYEGDPSASHVQDGVGGGGRLEQQPQARYIGVHKVCPVANPWQHFVLCICQ